jgi:hypothetical protein
MRQMLHFLALFSYLNILCFEVKYGDIFASQPIESNDTLIEYVLEHVLMDIPTEIPKQLPSIIYDEYRIFSICLLLAIATIVLCWLASKHFFDLKPRKHPVYISKTQCLSGYYRFLSRYQLF